MATRTRARFVEPMLLLRTDELPDDADRWAYQLKLDGYRHRPQDVAIRPKLGRRVAPRDPTPRTRRPPSRLMDT